MESGARPALNQLNLIAFRRVDKRDRSVLAIRVRTVRERVAFFRGLASELLEVVDLERQVGEIRTDHDGTALIEFADFNFFLAPRSFKENEL